MLARDIAAHLGPQAIGADDAATMDAATIGRMYRDLVAVVLDRFNAGAGGEGGQRQGLDLVDQHIVQISTMDHRIRVAKALLDLVAGGHAQQFFTAQGIAENDVVGEHRPV